MTDASNTAPEARGRLIVADYSLQLISVFPAGRDEMARITGAFSPISKPTGPDRDRIVDQYMSEYRNVMFLDDHETHEVLRFERTWPKGTASARFIIHQRDGTPGLSFELTSVKAFAFPGALGDLGLFSLEVHHIGENLTLDRLSSLGNDLRNFDTKLVADPKFPSIDTVEKFIEQFALPNIDIRRNSIVHQFSGSKLKAFLVVDIESPQEPRVIRELLYDIGCFVPIGSAGGNTHLTPSSEYLEQIIKEGVRPFRNYQALTFHDAFVAVGSQMLVRDSKKIDYASVTWADTYLRIYLHNLYVKFRSHQLTVNLHHTASKNRDRCMLFLVQFDLQQISYNFLPNLMHRDMRRGLDIEAELKALRSQVEGLSKLLEEDRQKRLAALVGLVSTIGTLQTVPTYLAYVQRVQNKVHIHGTLFWLLTVPLTITAALIVGAYLFPAIVRKAHRWYKRRF